MSVFRDIIIGESCTGKPTLAEKLRNMLDTEVYTGKDYIRLAKNENMAKKFFQEKMCEATSEMSVIYVICEKEHLELLPEKAFRIFDECDVEVAKLIGR